MIDKLQHSLPQVPRRVAALAVHNNQMWPRNDSRSDKERQPSGAVCLPQYSCNTLILWTRRPRLASALESNASARSWRIAWAGPAARCSCRNRVLAATKYIGTLLCTLQFIGCRPRFARTNPPSSLGGDLRALTRPSDAAAGK